MAMNTWYSRMRVTKTRMVTEQIMLIDCHRESLFLEGATNQEVWAENQKVYRGLKVGFSFQKLILTISFDPV